MDPQKQQRIARPFIHTAVHTDIDRPHRQFTPTVTPTVHINPRSPPVSGLLTDADVSAAFVHEFYQRENT